MEREIRLIAGLFNNNGTSNCMYMYITHITPQPEALYVLSNLSKFTLKIFDEGGIPLFALVSDLTKQGVADLPM